MKKVIWFLAFAFCAIMLSGCSGSKVTIDFEKCVSVNFSGYNGEGTAYISTDSGYVFSLLGDMNALTAAELVASFEIESPENNGRLSNGDKLLLKVSTDKELLKNAKVAVKNTELEFSVSGLEEKPTLDVFANVSFEVKGFSPECTVSVNYSGEGLSAYSLEVVDGDYSKRYKNGDRVTVKIKDSVLENLRRQYVIEETSREFIVQADGAYILTPDDLDAAGPAKLNETAQKNLEEQIQNILDDKNAAGKWVIIKLTGENMFSVGSSNARVTSIENVEFNSSYVGTVTEKGAFGGTTEHRYVYFFYDADFSHNYKKTETVHGILLLQFADAAVTSDEITFSSVSVGARKDFQTAYDEFALSGFKKLS